MFNFTVDQVNSYKIFIENNQIYITHSIKYRDYKGVLFHNSYIRDIIKLNNEYSIVWDDNDKIRLTDGLLSQVMKFCDKLVKNQVFI